MISELSLEDIDFEVPYHVIYHYFISGTIAAILNISVVYLIVFHSGRIDTFRYYLLAFQVACILADVNVTFLMQPIGLFPICAGYSYGIMSTVFNWTSHSLMTLSSFFLSTQIETLTICFLRKHRAIMLLGFDKTLNIPGYLFVLVLFSMFPFSIAYSLNLSNVGREEQLKVLKKDYPEFAPHFESLREFQFYVMNTWMHLFFFFVLLGILKASGVIAVTVVQMYRVLQNTQRKLSARTVAKHKTALKGLLAQFMTTPVAVLPTGIVALTVLIPSEHSQKIAWYSITVMTTHSILNSIVVMFTYPEFRRTVMFWIKEEPRKTTIISLPQ